MKYLFLISFFFLSVLCFGQSASFKGISLNEEIKLNADSVQIGYRIKNNDTINKKISSKVYYNIWAFELFRESYDDQGILWSTTRNQYNSNNLKIESYQDIQKTNGDGDLRSIFKYNSKNELIKVITYKNEYGKWIQFNKRSRDVSYSSSKSNKPNV